MTGDLGDPIGAGGQYKIYDAGDGRVLKVPNTLEEAHRVHEGWSSSSDSAEALATARQGLWFRDNNVPRLLRLVARYPDLSVTLGNPIPEADGSFTQDRVRMLSDVFENSDRSAILACFEGYADCIRACWRYGLHDYMCAFHSNNGLDGSGRVVFIDFGEVASFTPFVRQTVHDRGWSSRFDEKPWLKGLIPEYLHSEYHRILGERLCADVLEAAWGAGLDDLDRALLDGPFLRERKHDIPELAARLMERSNTETNRHISGFSSAAMERLMEHPWGYPVELESVVMRAAETCQEGTIESDDLDISGFPASPQEA
ncbi:hypothetical protein ACFL6X_01180 [Candidatus Latescibacterota bacterium]